ncbi:MAG: hypothetical protein ABL931_02505 [Usitatibacteraceae bacterium]
MKLSNDHDIDALLRGQFEGPVRDEGFSDHVIQQMPPRHARAMWPLWIGILAGIGTCWFSLLSTPLLQTGWQGWVSGKPSASAVVFMVVVAGMSLLAGWWTTMEPADR